MKESTLKKKALRVSVISIGVNLLLAIMKLLAGILGHSQALIADAVHSASDVLTTLIVVASLLIASKEADDNHEYGHQKFESLASLFLGILLAHVGVKIGIQGVKGFLYKTYLDAQLPSLLPAIAALASIAIKEVMFLITICTARREKSNALKADAWHHRSDALSSVGSLIGVLFARSGFPIMDSIASFIICLFILKTALEIILDACKALTDCACDKETENSIRETVLSISEVQKIDLIKTRVFGSGIYVDLEIQLDAGISFTEAHAISEKVHDLIEVTYPAVWHCMVHINPQ